MSAPRVGAIELGGTKTVVLVGNGSTIIERKVIPTTTPAMTMAAAVDTLAAWDTESRLFAIGIASFGPVRVNPRAEDYGRILKTPKPGWTGANILGPIRSRFNCPINIDTDVNAAALAEHQMGAGRGFGTIVYLTIGTGLGGGVLVDGQPVHGMMHPEIGHMRTRRRNGKEFQGTCPFHGDCIEGLIAGPALEARLPRHPSEMKMTDPEWGPIGRELAELLSILLMTLSPRRIIVGGGVTTKQPHLLCRARAELPELLGGYLPDIDAARLERVICLPALGDDAGPMGALLLGQRALGG